MDGDVRVTCTRAAASYAWWWRIQGIGIPEDPRTDRDGGFGLSMIEGIASSLEVEGGDGTELDMRFDMGQSKLETVDGAAPGIDPAERIMRRLVAVVAAQADLPTDRLVEALLIAEITARHALRHLIGDEIEIALDRQGDAFELSVGPLEEGGAERVVADSEIPVVGSVVERLADGVRTEQAEDVESLVIRSRARGASRRASRVRQISAGSSTISSSASMPVSSNTRATRLGPCTTTSRPPASRWLRSSWITIRSPLESRNVDLAEVEDQRSGCPVEARLQFAADPIHRRHVDLSTDPRHQPKGFVA